MQKSLKLKGYSKTNSPKFKKKNKHMVALFLLPEIGLLIGDLKKVDLISR